MNCLIIAERMEKNYLEGLAKDIPEVKQVFVALGGNEILSVLARRNIDVLFCPASRWDWRFLEAVEKEPKIVFVFSAREKCSPGLYKELGFCLREPYTAEEVGQLFERLGSEKAIFDNYFLLIRYERMYHKVRFPEIQMVGRMNNSYIRVCTSKGNFMIAGTMNKMLERLPGGVFERTSHEQITPVKVNFYGPSE